MNIENMYTQLESNIRNTDIDKYILSIGTNIITSTGGCVTDNNHHHTFHVNYSKCKQDYLKLGYMCVSIVNDYV